MNSRLPAHPTHTRLDQADARDIEVMGVTKLEYFAAHAPIAPEWFEPTGYEEHLKPKIPEAPTGGWTEDEQNEWWESGAYDPDYPWQSQTVAKFAQQHHEATLRRRAWQREKNFATETQWRWEYARRMLEPQS